MRQRVLDDPVVRSYLTGLIGRRPALVLSGGGGKGAYEAGVMLALYDCHVRLFSAIAGTSVGALNAALCHEMCRTNDRTIPLRIWADISPEQVLGYGWTRLIVVVIVRAILGILMMPMAYALKTIDRLSRASTDIGDSKLAIAWFAIRETLVGMTLIVVLPLVIGAMLKRAGLNLSGPTVAVWAACVSVAAAVAFTWWLPRLNLVDNAPLSRKISATLDFGEIRRSATPVYVTVAATLRGFVATHFRSVLTFNRWHDLAWPRYLRLSEAPSDQEAALALLTSAAIPEVFPGYVSGSQLIVDGGVADNTPIVPVCGHNPGAIVAVYLDDELRELEDLESREMMRSWIITKASNDSSFPTTRTRQEDEWKSLRRVAEHMRSKILHEAQRLAATGEADPVQVTLALRAVARKGNPWAESEYLPIRSNRKLGGLLTGTLNFNARKAKHLIALGYRDTLRRIQEIAHSSLT